MKFTKSNEYILFHFFLKKKTTMILLDSLLNFRKLGIKFVI